MTTASKRSRLVLLLLVLKFALMMTMRVDASANDATRRPFRVWTNEMTGSSNDEISNLPKSKSSSSSQSSTGSLTGSEATVMKKLPAISRAANHSASRGAKKNGSLIDEPRNPVPQHAVADLTTGSQGDQETTSADSLAKRNNSVFSVVLLASIGALFCVLLFSGLLYRHRHGKKKKKKKLHAVEEPSSHSPTVLEDEATTPRHSSFLRIVDGSEPILQCDAPGNVNSLHVDMNSVMVSMPLEEEFCDVINADDMKISAVSGSDRSHVSWDTSPSVDSDSALRKSSHSLLGRYSVSTTDSKPSSSLEDPSSVDSDPIQSPTWALLVPRM